MDNRKSLISLRKSIVFLQLPGPRFRLKKLLAKSVNDLFVLLEIHRALGKQSSHKNLGFPNGNQRFSSISLAMIFWGWNRKSEFVFWSKEESRHYNNQKKCVLLSHQIGVVFLLAYICVLICFDTFLSKPQLNG